MTKTGIPALLRERMRELGIPSQRALRRLLAAHNLPISQTSITNWFRGKPIKRGHLVVLLDVLDVHGPARLEVYRLAVEASVNPNAA